MSAPVFSKEVRESWDTWLAAFRAELLPVFTRHGFSPDAALIAYATYKSEPTDPDAGEPWRKS